MTGGVRTATGRPPLRGEPARPKELMRALAAEHPAVSDYRRELYWGRGFPIVHQSPNSVDEDGRPIVSGGSAFVGLPRTSQLFDPGGTNSANRARDGAPGVAPPTRSPSNGSPR
jgi:hypothetical protein